MRNVRVVTRRSKRSVARSVRNRLQFERLEPRQLLSNTYTVTNTNDDTNSGSLRWAIGQVNKDSTPDVIDFTIPGTGLHTITLSSTLGPLPRITNSVVIDGTSQTGYSGTPLIAIDGSSLTSADYVLWATAGSSTIQGLAIVGCPGAGIVLTTAGNNLIQSCYIGTPDGTNAKANGVGLEIFGSAGNTIGGSTASALNVISGNTNEGISIGDAQATDSNLIEGNYIGVNSTGTVGLGNGQDGLLLDHSALNTISGNVISGNTGDGILIQQVNGTSTSNTITDNQIGTSSGGASAIPNTLNGIELNAVSSTTIVNNVVSGNTENGVLLDTGTTSTVIQSNMIGTNPAGTLPLANGQDGIQSVSSSGVTIGGSAQGQGNLLSGNKQNGINLEEAFTQPNNTGVLIQGNIIGLDAAGTATLANGNNGIWQNGSDGTTIGGTTALTRNLISGNQGEGISLGTGDNALVEGNYIGTDVTGTKALGNQIGLEFTNASYATIGGTVAGSGNLISGNSQSGIDCFVIGSTAELIEGNLVGVDVSGVHALPNIGNGIRIAGPTDCTIGGTVASAANVISANGGDGVSLTVGPSNGLLVEGNYIGTDSNGDRLGNGGNGVTVWSNNITIGGTTSGAGNVIAFNGKQGITLVFSVYDNSFLSNSIYENGGLGISLGDQLGEDVPTPNHLDEQGFTPPGPNEYQNYPVLTSAKTGASSTEIVGTLNSGANTSYLVQFFASPAADPSGYGQGELYLGSTTVTTGSNYNASIDAQVPTVIPLGWVVSATATDPLGNTSEFSQDIASTGTAVLGVQISGSPSPVYAGATLTYTVTVTNSGPDAAPNMTVTDTLPPNIGSNVTAITSVSGVTPTISNGAVTADLGLMQPNTSATVTITVQPTAAAVPQITDQVSVTSNDALTVTDSLTTTVNPAADLTLNLQGSPGTAHVGDTVTYSLTATNNGPSDAANVVLSDTLPSNITSNVTATTSVSGVTPVISNGQVTASIGTLAAGTTATMTITVQPDAAAVPGISDSANITSGTYNSNTNYTPPSVTTVVQAAADLAVVIAASPNPVPAGQDVTYTLTATNNGLSDATGVVVTDTIPSGATFVSATGGVTPNSNGVLTFSVGNLADNASTTLSVVVATSGSTPSPATDQATITSNVYDPDSNNNTATASVPVTPVSDLSITMSGSPNPVYAGSSLTYTIKATNSGPSTDPAAVVTDTLPANVTFVSATGGATPSGGVVTLNLGSLAANASSTVTIVVTPTAAAAGSGTGTITNSAVITGEYNSNSSDSTSVNTTVNASTAIALEVTASPSSAVVGQDLTYTVTATNNGPSDATGVILTDTLPADITSNVTAVTSVTGVTAVVANGQVTANFGGLNDNASVTLTITVVPTLAALSNSPMVDTATIANNEFNPNPNTATSSVPVTPVSDLSITMAGSPNPVYAGGNLTYTITATNTGPSTDPAAVVTDTLPANVTFVSATGGATPSGDIVSLNLGSLAANASSAITIVVSPTAAAAGTITNSAVINGQYNSNLQNSTSVNTTVKAATAIELQVTAGSTSAYAGQNLTYTVTATNDGPSNATGVVLTDTLPVDITSNVTATTSVTGVTATVANGQVTANFGNLNDNASATLTITVVPTGQAVSDSPIVDTATITNNEFNSNSNSTTVSAPVLAAADLAITQFTESPNPVVFGDNLTYTAIVTNNGPSPATGVSLTTPLSSNVLFVSGNWTLSGSGGAVRQSGSDLVAAIGNLAVGASATVTLVVTPQQAAIGQLAASVTATANEYPANASPVTQSVTTTVFDRPGTLQFSTTNYEVPETAGGATITIVRTDGLRGQVSVNFTTFSMGATAGLDYTPTSGTIVFPAGVASETIQIPVLANPYDNHNELVGLALGATTGGAVLGGLGNATLTIQDVDPNFNSPMVTSVDWTGSATSITSLVIRFSEPLAPATADNPANFQVTSIGRHGTFSGSDGRAGGRKPRIKVTRMGRHGAFGSKNGQNDSFDPPMYNPSNWTVTLFPSQPLASNQFYGLVINGAAPGGITDIAGNELAGAGPGHPGTNYTALFAQGNHLTYTDAGGNQVTLTVQHGGYLQDLLTGSGLGQQLVLVGAVPHKTVLSGKVVKGKHGSGRAYLGYSIYGLGQFGNVKIKMSSPPFVIQKYPFSPGVSQARPAETLARPDATPEVARRDATAVRPRTSTRSQTRISMNASISPAVRHALRIGMLNPNKHRLFHTFPI